jgi:hypothetical protein
MEVRLEHEKSEEDVRVEEPVKGGEPSGSAPAASTPAAATPAEATPAADTPNGEMNEVDKCPAGE